MYLVVFSLPQKPLPFAIEVDKLSGLAVAVDKIKKRGEGATIKIYEATPKNYTLTYKDKQRAIIDKVPSITLT